MQSNVNQSKQFRIYLKSSRQWVEVPEEVYREHYRYYDAFRKRHQAHGQCACPKNKFWLCDGDCLTCEFRRAGDMLSLDYESENEDGDSCTPLVTHRRLLSQVRPLKRSIAPVRESASCRVSPSQAKSSTTNQR